jgi:monoterpene epsilon-lactone hydrolase
MQSIQSFTVQAIVNIVRNSLFIHKTETTTHRKNFERLANIIKFPRFVKMEELNYAHLPAAWFIPNGFGKSRVILYLHGGGYCVGSYNTHKALIARIARATGYKILAPNYRMAPENPFPTALEDAIIIYKQMLDDGYNNIILSGDSAGGGLSLALTQKLKEENLPAPAALILLSPWTDLTLSGDSIEKKADKDPLIAPHLLDFFAKKYIAHNKADNPLISPLFLNFKNFPPTLIHVGGNEILLDDSTRLAKKMNNAGVKVEFEIYKNQMHVFQYLSGIVPEANNSLHKIGEFVKSFYLISKKDHEDSLEVY